MDGCEIINFFLIENCRRKIICLRQEKGWNLEELAEKAGIELKLLEDIESGRGNLDLCLLRKILDSLGYFDF